MQEALQNDNFSIPPLTERLPDVEAALADPATVVWGLRDTAGRLLATVRTTTSGDSAYLGRLGVVPDKQGSGLGGRLLAHAEAALPPTVTRMTLVTGARSSANHAFYRRRGWVQWDDPDRPPSTVAFAKTLRAAG